MTTTSGRSRSKPSRAESTWHVVDADGKTLGRVSTEIAVLLQGKHKPTYVPYLNMGDFVVVINAEKVRVTGNKLEDKRYYRHSGYHGGLTERTLSDVLDKDPTRALEHAIKGMLPKNTLGRRMLSRLKLYAGDSHPHAAQINAGARRRRAREAAEEQVAKPNRRTRAASRKPKAEPAAEAPEAAAEIEAMAEATAADTAAEDAAEADIIDSDAPAAEAGAPQEATAASDGNEEESADGGEDTSKDPESEEA